jgi:AraC-like DNA-binding protein
MNAPPQAGQVERRVISVSFIEEALDSLRRRGLPVEGVLAAADLPENLREPVSAEAYGRMWLALARELDDEFFGLAARPMRPGGFTLLCHCLLHSRNVEQALRRALRFLNLVLDEPRGELIVESGLARVELRESGPPRSAFAYRTYWIVLHGVICWFAGRRLPLRRIDFRCSEPDFCGDYRLFFGAPVEFGANVSLLAFDSTFLRLPVNRNEAAMRVFLRHAPGNILVRYAHDAGLAANVRRRLRALAPSDWPNADDLALRLRMPASTLRHKLQLEGHSYRSIREEALRGLAIEALTSSRIAIADLAASLGFSEPGAFHRAFRKWCGATPAAYRRAVASGSTENMVKTAEK